MINKTHLSPYGRAEDFANRLGIRLPILNRQARSLSSCGKTPRGLLGKECP